MVTETLTLKVLYAGPKAVGKSTTAKRLEKGVFIQNLGTTIGSGLSSTIRKIYIKDNDYLTRKQYLKLSEEDREQYQEIEVKLNITDAGGQDSFRSFQQRLGIGVDLAVCFYQVVSNEEAATLDELVSGFEGSLDSIPEWLGIARKYTKPLITLVGNKVDLITEEIRVARKEGNEERVRTLTEYTEHVQSKAKAFAEEHGLQMPSDPILYSAKTGEGFYETIYFKDDDSIKPEQRFISERKYRRLSEEDREGYEQMTFENDFLDNLDQLIVEVIKSDKKKATTTQRPSAQKRFVPPKIKKSHFIDFDGM